MDKKVAEQLWRQLPDPELAADMMRIMAANTRDAFILTKAEPIAPPDGPEIVYVNPAFERMTGWHYSEIIGKTPRVLQTGDTDPRELAKISKALKAWKPVRAELLNQRKDGTRFWVELDIVPVPDRNGWFHFWASVQRDITERKLIEQRLYDARMAAESASAAKSRFLANVSHELRTPLNAIQGFTELMLSGIGGAPSQRHQEYLQDIRGATSHILDIVQEMLDLTRIEAGRLDVPVDTGNPVTAFRQACNLVRSEMVASNITLDDRVAEAGPVNAVYNHTRLVQCITNILNNAIRYCPSGSAITVCIEKRDHVVALVFNDNGPGMEAHELETALSPFGRVSDPTHGDIQGAGLGLPIARELMRAQGGELTIKSTLGEGTIVALMLSTEIGASVPVVADNAEDAEDADDGSNTGDGGDWAENDAIPLTGVKRPAVSQKG